MFAERLDAAPDDFAGGDEGVEVGGRVVRYSCWKNAALQNRCGQWRALQVLDRIEQRVETSARLENALPMGLQAGEHLLLDRLDLFS